MSFRQVRTAVSAARELSFAGGAVLLVEPSSGNMTFSIQSAAPSSGAAKAAVDRGDGDAELIPVVGLTGPGHSGPGQKTYPFGLKPGGGVHRSDGPTAV